MGVNCRTFTVDFHIRKNCLCVFFFILQRSHVPFGQPPTALMDTPHVQKIERTEK